jgi:regulator of cell morphogenesis and NO signaling
LRRDAGRARRRFAASIAGAIECYRSCMTTATTTLGDLARAQPSATRVFLRHRLDFCCGGKRTLADACAESGLDANAILGELAAEASSAPGIAGWDARSQAELADHVVARYHAGLRRDFPPLVEAARKVERVHAGKPDVPVGLAAELEAFWSELEAHMMKEERVLFPALRDGARGSHVAAPIHVMEHEHDHHAEHLARVRALTGELKPPRQACATWRALYHGLETIEAELMEHIHLENNVLFARAA